MLDGCEFFWCYCGLFFCISVGVLLFVFFVCAGCRVAIWIFVSCCLGVGLWVDCACGFIIGC